MGNTFGGQLLQWAEEIAILSARKHVTSALAANLPLVIVVSSVESTNSSPTYPLNFRHKAVEPPQSLET
jgi:hypothetical protein